MSEDLEYTAERIALALRRLGVADAQTEDAGPRGIHIRADGDGATLLVEVSPTGRVSLFLDDDGEEDAQDLSLFFELQLEGLS